MQEISRYIDKELFMRLAEGDELSYRYLVKFFYKKFLPLTISLVKSEATARDIMQEVFLKLWLNRSTLTTIDNPEAWLNVVVSNTTSNHIRTQLRYELRIKQLIPVEPEAEELLEEMDAKFTQSLIDEAVNMLPAKRKEVFLLNRRGRAQQERNSHKAQYLREYRTQSTGRSHHLYSAIS